MASERRERLSDEQQERESEASQFAMSLLVPTKLLRIEVKRAKWCIDLCDDDGIKELSKKFGVSLTVMGIRLHQVFGGFMPKKRSQTKEKHGD